MISPDLQHGHRHRANTCLWLLNTDTLAFSPDLYTTSLEVLSQDYPLRTLHILEGLCIVWGTETCSKSQFISVLTKQHGKKGLLISLSRYLFFPGQVFSKPTMTVRAILPVPFLSPVALSAPSQLINWCRESFLNCAG